jgi:hypothetical protein
MDTPLKNLRDVLSSRQFETNASLRAVAQDKDELHAIALRLARSMPEGKADSSPLSALPIESKALPKGKLRDFGKIRVKSQASQFRSVSAVHTVMHIRADGSKDMQIVRDVVDNDACPIDPAWKQGQKKIAKASCKYMRKAYIRSREARESVVVVKV